ncbi:MAG TPA: hypothetical protein DIC18_03270 [Clostridiales bacterium]|nr:hypothetical protein [Clostridiales bacterium]HCU56338.1 hypothetical protein [Clostridiales bacterium]
MANLTQLFLASGEPRLSNAIGKLIHSMYGWIGNFGWMVVVFTIFLKLILSPLDIWQKRTMHKNNRAMKVIAPELEKLKKTYANAPDVLQQKQMELYKKNGYSMTGGCLPALVTIVIFFVVFAGFNAAVRYENEMIVYKMANDYKAYVTENPDITPQELNEKMVASYDEKKQSWLWIDNVFMADTLVNSVPTAERFTGSGLGYINAKMPKNLPSTLDKSPAYDNGYDAVMGPAANRYNKRSTFDAARWNGYFILPFLSILLSVFSMKITKNSTPEMPTQTDESGNPIKNKQGMMKIMNWMMPILMGVFALFYSAAFCIYMFTNSLITVLFNVIYNVIAKKSDAKEEDRRLSRTFK